MGRRSRRTKKTQFLDLTQRGEHQKIPLPSPETAAPWIVLVHGENGEHQTFCNLSNPKKHQLRSVPELRNKFIRGIFYGWLVLKNEYHNYFSLWNPTSLETIKLPLLKPENADFHSCILTLPPSDPKSKVILTYYKRNRIVYCRPGDHRWRTYEFQLEPEGEILERYAMCNGLVYASTFPLERLYVIETGESKGLSLKVLGVKLRNLKYIMHLARYLVESLDELFLVNKLYRGQSWDEIEAVEVFKLDFSRMIWVEMENLQDRAFLLSRNYSMSCSVANNQAGIEANCIYFLSENDDRVFCYNLEKQSVSICMHCPDVPNLQYAPCWMMPEDNFRLDDTQIVHEEDVERDVNNSKDKDCIEENVDVLVLEKGPEAEYKQDMKNITDLPSDVLTLIWERLFEFDYLCFRAVCKKLRLLAPPIYHGFGLQSSHMFYPCFMFFKSGIINLVDMKRIETCYIKNPIPESLSGSRIFFSKDGWLLMSLVGREHVFFFNPFEKIIHQIPEKAMYGLFMSMGFSSSITSLDCSIVGIAQDSDNFFIFSLSLKDKKWNHHFIGDQFIPSNNTPVFQDGSFYFLDTSGRLGAFRIEEDRSWWEVLAKPKSPCADFEYNYLVECDGDILSVFVGKSGQGVSIFRLDRFEQAWFQVESLGQNMLFVSHSSCLSMVSKIPGTENKIYFPRLVGKSIMFYSLETGKYHTFQSQISMEDFSLLSEEPLHSCWIQ